MGASLKDTLALDYVAEFYAWLIKRRLVAESTAKDYVRSVWRVASFSGLAPRDLRSWDLEAFLASDYAWHTKNLGLIAVRMWHRWGADRHYWRRDPEMLDLKLRKRRQSRPKALTLDQARLLITLARSPVEKRVVYLGLFAGLRPGEIRSLSSVDWYVAPSGIEVIYAHGKQTSEPREIPVHPMLRPLRGEILSVAPSRKDILAVAHRFREPLNVADFVVKWLRATFGQALRGRGVERDVISSLLGHAIGSVTTESYVPVTDVEKLDAMLRLSYGAEQLRLL